MKSISEIKSNLTLVELEGRKIYLVGTAHVSRTSAELVEETIREYQPDTVCIELCEGRHKSLADPDRWKETDIFEVIKSGRAYVLMAQLALAGFQKKIGDQLDIKPGDEMRAAIDAAKTHGAELSLVDRDIRTTLKRAWGKTGIWTVTKMFAAVIASLFSAETIEEHEVEKLKEGDGLKDIMAEFAEAFPSAKDVLIDERDSYMAEKIRRSPGNTLVSVVGAAHVPGIKQILGDEISLTELETIPPPRKSLIALGWGIPAAILLMMGYGFVNSGLDTSVKMLEAWIIANGSLASIGAIAALAHPATIITAFIAAPIASLNPMVGTGWVCGLVEALARKPRVRDLETVGEDILTVKGLWHNRVSKILLVVVFATIGSLAGTFIGAGSIVALL